jgi:hypothetical protein
MLTPNGAINCADIADIQRISAGHPVYKVTGWDGEAIVVKKENAMQAGRIATSASFMRVVDTHHNVNNLDMADQSEIMEWLSSPLRVARETLDTTKLAHYEALEHDMGEFGAAFLNEVKFTKMPVKRIIELEDAYREQAGGDKTSVRRFAAVLKGRGGLQSLGKIVAADLFNGISDRFDPAGGIPAITVKNAPDVQPQVLRNLGNVMLSIEDEGAVLSGLDFWDRNTGWRQWEQTVNDLEPNYGNYPGRLLNRSGRAQLLTFCSQIIDDLEMILGPRNRKNPLGTNNRLGVNRRGRLHSGIRQGKQLIAAKVATVANSANAPAGLASRRTAAGMV